MAERSLIDRIIDAVDSLAERYRRPITIIGAIWLGLSFASWAGFITLPELAILTGKPAVYASCAFNALWWGWMNPRILRRRAVRLQNSEVANG